MTMNDLKNYLQQNANLSSDDFHLIQNEVYQTGTWYINLLIGFSAWLGSILILGSFFGLMAFLLESMIGVILGLTSILGVVIVSRSKNIIQNVFSEQVLLACSLIGLGVFGVSVFNFFKPNSSHFFLQISILETTVFFFFINKTRQFISVLITAFGISFFIHQNASFVVFEFMIVIFCFLSFLLNLKQTQFIKMLGVDKYNALSLGLLFTCFSLLIFSIANTYIPTLGQTRFPYLLLAFGFGSTAYLLKSYSNEIGISFLVNAIFLIIIGIFTYKNPEILVVLSFVLVSFAQNKKYHLILSIAFLAIFISHFYYSLSFSLLYKSISLMALGALFIVASILYSKKGIKNA
jgi:hypothetical protein